jgi:hypothetical protein
MKVLPISVKSRNRFADNNKSGVAGAYSCHADIWNFVPLVCLQQCLQLMDCFVLSSQYFPAGFGRSKSIQHFTYDYDLKLYLLFGLIKWIFCFLINRITEYINNYVRLFFLVLFIIISIQSGYLISNKLANFSLFS